MSDMTLPNETLRQQLSAFVDGELPSAEAELLVRRLARDTDLKQAMSRYLLAGEAMRAPGQAGPTRGFSAKIAAVIERDTSRPAAAQVPAAAAELPRWLKPAAGMAVAAGVAAFVVFGFRQSLDGSDDIAGIESLQPVTITAKRMNDGASYIVPEVTNAAAVPIAAAQLTNYVVAHSEYSSPLVRRNMLTGLLAGDDTANATPQGQTAESTPAP